MYIKALFRAGHVGNGKYHEMVRYMDVNNINEILDISKTMPRVKKRRGLISCSVITYEQYLAGKAMEALDPYLNRELSTVFTTTKSFLPGSGLPYLNYSA